MTGSIKFLPYTTMIYTCNSKLSFMQCPTIDGNTISVQKAYSLVIKVVSVMKCFEYHNYESTNCTTIGLYVCLKNIKNETRQNTRISACH